MPWDAENGELATIDELEELLCSVARGVLPDRSQAIVYSRCHAALLESPAKNLLPGFIYQCLTILKFKDFITLYDPDTSLREAFVHKTFERCRSMVKETSAPKTAASAARNTTGPREWML